MDWALLELDGVRETIRRAASKVAGDWAHLDVDDVAQEGLVIVASKGTEAREALTGGLGRFYHWVWCDLTNYAEVEYRKRGLYQKRGPEVVRLGELRKAELAPEPALQRRTSEYDARMVGLLLTSMWNSTPGWGMVRDIENDPQMPRAKSNPAHGNTVWAMLADIQRAWDKCPLTLREKQVLLLYYGMDWTEQEIADCLGLAQPVVHRKVAAGTSRIVKWLNAGSGVQVRVREDERQ